jgi:hypothetical protein
VIFNNKVFSNSPPSTIKSLAYLLFCLIIFSVSSYVVHGAYCLIDYSSRVDYGHLWFAELEIPQLVIGADVSFYKLFSFR